MTLFYSENTRSIGGKKRRRVIPVVSDEFGELWNFRKKYADHCELIMPERGVKAYKSRRLPVLLLDEEWRDLLQVEDAEKVSAMHVKVLTWVLRKQIYLSYHPEPPAEIIKFFDAGIRGTLRELLKSGLWIDEPETPGIKTFQSELEKIDLVRCSHLKFSSQQPGEEKLFYREKREYDRQLEEFGDPDTEYREGSSETRARLREERPWMAEKWIEVYGQ